MAKLKIRGQLDFVFVPDAEARLIKEQLENGELKGEAFISMGNFSCKAREIVSFVFESQATTPENTYAEDYRNKRNSLMGLEPDARLIRQMRWYNLVCEVFKVVPNWENDKIKIGEYLSAHPLRMWADPAAWLPRPTDGRVKSEFHGRVGNFIGMVLAQDANEERVAMDSMGISVE